MAVSILGTVDVAPPEVTRGSYPTQWKDTSKNPGSKARYLLKSSGKIQDTSKNPTYKQAGVVCRYERKAEKQAGYPAPQLAAARSTSGGARTHRKHINKFSTRDDGLLPDKRERTAKDDDRSSFSFVYKSARRTPCRLASPETFVEVTTSALCASGSSSTSSASSAASW